MAGATSLVQLILKKWGDDAAGAAKELEEKVGFPESVANRIATGELPMDAESVARRAQEQGYGSVLYHGGRSDINALDDSFQGMTNMESEGTGLWMSDEPDVANSFAGDEDYTGGALYPLRVKSSNPATIDAKGSNWGAIPTEDGMKVGGSLLELDGGTLDSNGLAKIAKEEGADSITFQNMSDVGPYYYGYDKASAPSKVVASLGTDKVRSPNAAFDPQYTGPNIMGGAALPVAAGLLAAGQSDDADAGFITKGGKTLLEAWHGSPHKFDKFSMDQIGTGEGAQAYGHGLYFADEIDVAKGYQPRDRDNEQWMYEQYKAAEEAGDQYMMDAWERAMMHDSPIELRASAADPDYDEYSQAAFAEVADALAANPGTGSLSRVEIDVTPESLLDWDRPLSEQSEGVRQALEAGQWDNEGIIGYWMDKSLENPSYDGNDLYQRLSGTVGSPQEASSYLSDRGIKGIKYLDGDSRAVGDGTSNYVIFDDSLINIAERGNATVPMLGATALGTAGLLAAPVLMGERGQPTTPEERGFKSWEEVSRDPTAPLPAPTWGEAMGKAGSNLMYLLGLPMTGLQGLARGGYGLLAGEDLTEAAAQAGNTMDVGWRDGLLDVSQMNPDKGADQAGAYVTEKTGDESLGWMAKMGLLLGGI